jgi:hypothetical protein
VLFTKVILLVQSEDGDLPGRARLSGHPLSRGTQAKILPRISARLNRSRFQLLNEAITSRAAWIPLSIAP